MAKRAARKLDTTSATVPKLAKFLSGYSNSSSRAGYKNSIESFLRCIYGLKKEDIKAGKIPAPDYNSLFELYLHSKRDNDADFIRFSEHLIETRPALSAKQTMTLVRYAMTYHGVTISKGTSQDIRRETMRGSAATVDRTLNIKIINAALQHCTIQGKALFLCLASNGARLNEMLTVSINDVDFDNHPVKMTFRGENTKTKTQRYTFISDEAAAAVQEWLKVRSQYIEMSNAKSKKLIARGLASVKTAEDTRLFPFSDASVTAWWNDALAASGELTKDEVTGRNQLRVHGFRKFFLSQMSLVISKEIPEFLAGHSAYLSGSYRRYDDETVAAEYLKAMHMVSVTGNKQVKELENELKEKMQEQAAKTEKHAETLEYLLKKYMKVEEELTQLQADVKAGTELFQTVITDPAMVATLKDMFKVAKRVKEDPELLLKITKRIS